MRFKAEWDSGQVDDFIDRNVESIELHHGFPHIEGLDVY